MKQNNRKRQKSRMTRCPFKGGLRKALENEKQYQEFIEEHIDDLIAAAADIQC